MSQKQTCPLCRKPVPKGENPYRPFCSLRCKTTDLGNWASGKYAIPTQETESCDEDMEKKEDLF